MNRLSPIFLALALILGTFGFYQQQQSTGLRTRVVELESAAAKTQAEASATTLQLEKLQEQTTTQKAVIEQLETHNKSLAMTPPPPAGGSAAAQGGEAKEDGNNFMKGLAKMYSDPKTRDTMRAQQTAQVAMMYSSFAKEAGLAPDVARQVLALLGDRQSDMASKTMAAMARGDLDPTKTGQDAEEAKKGYDDQLKAVLGDAGFKKLGDYEKSIGDRVALDTIQRQLSASGTTLESAQQQGLLDIMREERERTKVTSAMGNDAVAQSKILQSDAATEKWLADQQEMNRRVLDRARTVLSADQVVAFEAAQKQFLDMQKMGVQMSRQMFQKK